MKRSPLFEWTMATALFLLGVHLLVWPEAMGASSFWLILSTFGRSWLTAVYLIVGGLRMMALFANGASKRLGPHVRAIGAFCGAAIWLQMDIALIGLIGAQGTPPSPGIPVYSALVVAELFATYRAAADANARTR